MTTSAASTARTGEPVWDDHVFAPLPALRGEHRAEFCVVGLGGSGLGAIARLCDAGADVIGVDAGQVGAGAAGRNGGFLLAGLAQFHHQAIQRFGRDRAVALYELTLLELERWYAAGVASVRRTGTLRIAADAAEWRDCENQLAAMHADSLPVELYEGAEGRGLLFPRDGAFQPLQRWRDLAGAVQVRGAQLFGASAVTRIDGTTVHCAQGRVMARRVLIAVDGGIEWVLPELAPRVRSARLQMLATAPTREVALARPVYFRDGYDYWQQDAAGRVVLGGGRDIGGAAEWCLPNECAPALPSDAVQQHLQALLRQRLGVTAPVTHRWAALVAYTDDGMPVFGEVRPQVFASGAYNGTGNIFGHLCGRALAELALGTASELARWLRP
jgi:glycine/D-amino acid oxidase-like deaminating enzyme